MNKIVIAVALMLGAMTTEASAQPTGRIGAFDIDEATDQRTDAKETHIITFGVESSEVAIGWVCIADTLYVLFTSSKDLIGDGREIPVTYRFAPAPAVTTLWTIERGAPRTGFLSMSEAQTFTAAALTNSTVTLRVTDRDGSTITDSFKLDGIRTRLMTLPCYRQIVHP